MLCVRSVKSHLLGLDWIERLNLLDVPLNLICNQLETTQRRESIDNLCSTLVTKIRHEFAPVFGEGLGCCTKMKAVPRLRTDARPVFRPKRPVPYAVLPILDQELDQLQSSGVIEHTQNGNYTPKQKPFKVGDNVYATDYRRTTNRWAAGVVTKTIGNVMYEVKVDQMLWRRHINQLRPRVSSASRDYSNPMNLETILSFHDVPRERSCPEDQIQRIPMNTTARRYPSRMRRPVETMQVIPTQKYYF